MQKVIKFTSELLAIELAATSLSLPSMNITPSEVLEMPQSRMSGNGVARHRHHPHPVGAGSPMASSSREPS